MLNPIVYVPGVSDPGLNQMLLLNKELVALDRPPWNKQDMGVLDVLWVLQQELVDDHLDGFKLGAHDVDLCDCVSAMVRHLHLELVC